MDAEENAGDAAEGERDAPDAAVQQQQQNQGDADADQQDQQQAAGQQQQPAANNAAAQGTANSLCGPSPFCSFHKGSHS